MDKGEEENLFKKHFKKRKSRGISPVLEININFLSFYFWKIKN
jgi:hypothetical protein